MVGTKLERTIAAYEFLRSRGLVHTQLDVALKLGMDKSNLSRAFKGDERYLTDKFLRRLNSAFGGLFSEDWLVSGEGEMLAPSISQTVNGDGNTSVAGIGNHVNTTADALIAEIAAQRRVTEKAQEQIDRLLSIIEGMQK